MPEAAQDRWNAETKFKMIRLDVGDNVLTLEGEHIQLDSNTFKLIDIWVKAITPVGQEDIDKLTGKLKKNTDALAASVAEHPSESLKEA